MKIGILGCGWLGLPLAENLLADHHHINGSTTSEDKLKLLQSKGIHAYHILINDDGISGQIDEMLDCDLLIINFPPKRSENVVDRYPRQIGHIKNKIGQSPIQKVIFISSTSVYPAINDTVSENTSVNPVRKSGIAVAKAEELITSNGLTFQTTIIRFSGLIGPDRNPGRFLSGKKELSGAESPVNLIHLDDCIAMIKAVIKYNVWGEILNGACPDHPSRKKYYELAAKEMNLAPPEFDETKKSDFKIVDGSKAEKIMDFRYQHRDLIQILRSTK